MTDDEVLDRFTRIRQWRAGDQRAPHKPLLLLLALGRLQAGEDRLAPYAELEGPLRRLLERYGQPRRRQHPEYPFWRLSTDDGLWQVDAQQPIELSAGGDARVSDLRRADVHGGLDAEVAEALRADPKLIGRVAADLLANHFPPSLHDEILDAVGLRVGLHVPEAVRRDPEFRWEVLRAYEYRCALCGYDGRLDDVTVGLDAAHVRWWAYDGPDRIENALALCALHHRALDRGVVGVNPQLRVTVSRHFHGGGRAKELIIDLTGRPLTGPQHGLPVPAAEHLAWHRSQVFKGEERTELEAAAEGRGTYDG